MSHIHLLNEIISHRELGAESWSAYISFSLEESGGTVLAETYSVYHNAKQPYKSRRERIGQQRISYNKAPFNLTQQLRLLEDFVPAQPRDTVSLGQRS
jgi:hypothetical protein